MRTLQRTTVPGSIGPNRVRSSVFFWEVRNLVLYDELKARKIRSWGLGGSNFKGSMFGLRGRTQSYGSQCLHFDHAKFRVFDVQVGPYTSPR